MPDTAPHTEVPSASGADGQSASGADSGAGDPQPMPLPNASLAQVLGAVLWSFFGVRKGRAMHRDVVAIRPHQVILVGIAIAALLVAVLLFVVHLIVASAS